MPIKQEAKSYSPSLSDFSYTSPMDTARVKILQQVAERRLNLSELSKQLGKNHAYLQQFIKRGVPAELPERVREQLSSLLGIDEDELRANPRRQDPPESDNVGDEDALVAIQKRKRRSLEPGEILEIDVRAGLGNGGYGTEVMVDGEVADGVRATWRLPVDFVRAELRSREAELEILPVDGDSMMPTLMPGDRVMINRRQNTPSSDGLYAIGGPYGVQIKRIEYIQGTQDPIMIKVISDNPLHSERELPADEIHVIGRVVCRISRM
ncbi:S24 family peptidase [Xanthobacter sp. VTT E-85241]|uniref:S24 family peptidase n=1 Tax=Roseixanthobacter finlandensis TaxID=3119922 RepID=UPI0037298611